MRAASAIQADCFAGNRLGPARDASDASEEQNGVAAPLRPRGESPGFSHALFAGCPRGPEGEGRWGESARADPPRGRAREALRKSFPRHCENRFPLSRDARGKTVNEKPARGLPNDNGPRRVGCAFCAKSITNEQNRSQMSMALCAKCAGKPRKAGKTPGNRRGGGGNGRKRAGMGGNGQGRPPREKKRGGAERKRAAPGIKTPE